MPKLEAHPIPHTYVCELRSKLLRNLAWDHDKEAVTKKQTRHGKCHPGAWHLVEALQYLGNESQHSHLAGLMAGSQAPEELILRWAAVRDLLVVQVPEGERKISFESGQADLF